MDTGSVLAFSVVMASLFYLGESIKDKDRVMSFIYRSVGVFFGWLLIASSGVAEGWIIAGFILSLIPYFLYVFLTVKNLTFEQFITNLKPVDQRSNWGALDEDE